MARDAAPRPFELAVEHHVHAVEDEAAALILEIEHAFHAEDVLALALHQVVQPFVDLAAIEQAGIGDADGRDFVVVMMMGGELALGDGLAPFEAQRELGGHVLAEHRIGARLVHDQRELRAFMAHFEAEQVRAHLELAAAGHIDRRFRERALGPARSACSARLRWPPTPGRT